MKYNYIVSGLLCLGFGLSEAAAQQTVPPLKKEFLDSTFAVLPSATGAMYRRETQWRDSTAGEVRDYYLSNGQLQSREELAHVAKQLPNGITETFTKSGQLTTHAEFTNGRRTGELRTYYPSGQLKRREQFAATGLSSGGECFAADGKPVPFFAYEVMPRYPEGDGGPQAIIRAMMRNFKYPKDALKAKVEGRVLVAFSVTEQGTVTDVHMIQSLFPSVDANAMQAVYQLKRFTPGQQDGRPVKVSFTMPISLRIQ
ncbi:MAG TPA: TonB family protein [Hymenobacter sp.]|uniref:TonB family protein n=1 Tax=Hymenobacter sp. TaxID=1898978 RepID=UPI002D7EDA70|nr:TonB family protein [Hymenobacter sp.]HET9504313.1 TonB family protein [Hymenobacter sp.]